MTQKKQKNLGETLREIDRLNAEYRDLSNQHSDCSGHPDDGPCGHYGDQWANALNYVNAVERKERLQGKDTWSNWEHASDKDRGDLINLLCGNQCVDDE